MRGSGFYLIFAILMPITVKLTGIYLEFALLVIPALCAAALKGTRFLSAHIGRLGTQFLSHVYVLVRARSNQNQS